MTFLAIDIGNTRLKWAQYAAPQPGAGLLAHGAVFLEQIDHLADSEWKALEAPTSMLGSIVAGEGVKRRVEEQLELWDITPRWVVSSPFAAGVSNGYDHPNRLGTDRWVALIGARHRVLAMGGTTGGRAAGRVLDLTGARVDTPSIVDHRSFVLLLGFRHIRPATSPCPGAKPLFLVVLVDDLGIHDVLVGGG